MNTITAAFVRAMTEQSSGETIRAYWKDGRASAVYPAALFGALRDDSLTDCITSETTGEILFMAEG